MADPQIGDNEEVQYDKDTKYLRGRQQRKKERDRDKGQEERGQKRRDGEREYFLLLPSY